MDLPYLKLLAIFILVLANGFFAASEFALIASRRSRIKHMVRRGDRRAIRIEKLHSQPDRFLATIQIGIAFLSTLAGVFGGAAFVISIAQMNAYLLLLPQWVTAVFLMLALVGFAGWNTPAGRLAGFTAAGYLAALAMVGQDFNQYWGSMIAPLLCLGLARGPSALVDLWRAARLGGRRVAPLNATA